MPHDVFMPALGMAQSTGVLVRWLKAPGDPVAEGEPLFEVETDKTTMEVEAQGAGFLTDVSAGDGDEVPVGQVIGRISETASDAGATAAAAASEAPDDTGPAPNGAAQDEDGPAPETASPPAVAPSSGATNGAAGPGLAAAEVAGGRILASPKARRLALEQGLDLARLVEAGHPQPYHVRDLETLRALPDRTTAAQPAAAVLGRRLVAETASDGFVGFAAWAAENHGIGDASALLAGLAAACLRRATEAPALCVAVETRGLERRYVDPDRPALGHATDDASAPAPDLVVRDLRGSTIADIALGPEGRPVLSLVRRGEGLAITLECDSAALEPRQAIALLTAFADRMEQPIRHLL